MPAPMPTLVPTIANILRVHLCFSFNGAIENVCLKMCCKNKDRYFIEKFTFEDVHLGQF